MLYKKTRAERGLFEVPCDEAEIITEEESFKQGASLQEGISGQLPMDTQYENHCADGYASKGFKPNPV